MIWLDDRLADDRDGKLIASNIKEHSLRFKIKRHSSDLVTWADIVNDHTAFVAPDERHRR